MLKTKTIRIDEQLHEDAKYYIKTAGISGGFSAYIQGLIIRDFKTNGCKLTKIKEDIK